MPLHPPCPTCASTGVCAYGANSLALCTGDPASGGAPCPYALEIERGLVAEGKEAGAEGPLPQ